MSLVKDTEHMIRLDDCFDSLLHRANYKKVKKYMRTYPAFLRGVAGSIPLGGFLDARGRGFNSKTTGRTLMGATLHAPDPACMGADALQL